MSTLALARTRALASRFRSENGDRSSRSTSRTILHVDLDCFFVSVERVLDPSLSQLPVIVGGSPESRGVVCSASREARALGVRSGMPTAAALRLCPEARFLPGRGRMYGRASIAAFKVMREFCPTLERASIDEAYLDLTSAEAAGRPAVDIAAELQRALLDRLGLPSSMGVASNKLVAKVACQRAKPEGILEVWPGYEEAFLAPFPLSDLPGVGPVHAERLRLFGLATVGDLARVSPALLEAAFGSAGRQLADRARGLGEDEVTEDAAPKSIGRERTFARDVVSTSQLVGELYDLAAEVAERARRQQLTGRTITLKLRTGDFRTLTRSRTLPSPTDSASEIAGVATFLLREAHDGRSPVRLVGVSLSQLGCEPVQQQLFAAAPPAAPRDAPAAPGGATLLSLASHLGLRPRD